MKLPTTLTLVQARSTLDTLGAEVGRAGADTAMAVDASGLATFDTSALAVLLDLQRRARAYGRTLELRAAPPKLAQLAALYGVSELLGLA